MSQKLDGMRAICDGHTLKSRQGKTISAPQWFLKDLPSFEIDGELWTKRNNFENIMSIVRQQTPDDRWQTISYNIFEIPNQPGGLLTRLAILEDYLAERDHFFLKIIPQTYIISTIQLKSDLEQMVKLGGEGQVSRKPSITWVDPLLI